MHFYHSYVGNPQRSEIGGLFVTLGARLAGPRRAEKNDRFIPYGHGVMV